MTTRIGFDGRALMSPAAGIRRYTLELFSALASRRPELQIVAVGAPHGARLPEGAEGARAPLSLPTNLGWMSTGLPWAARAAGLALFHAPSYTAPLFGVRPLVLTIHDVSYAAHPEWYPYRRDPVRRAFYRHSALNADAVITDSEFSRREIVAAYGIHSAHVHVVPLAAREFFVPATDSGRNLRQRFLLHVGDLHERRNVGIAVKALAAVRSRRSDFHDVSLMLIGTDRGAASGLRDIGRRAAGAAPLLHFRGAVSDEELRAAYRSAAALIYPSRYEGFGLPVLEAMACGTPVIAARTSALPEVGGDAALWLDPDDEAGWSAAIERVVDDADWRRELGDAGRQQAARFSWQRTAEETAKVYAVTLGQAGA